MSRTKSSKSLPKSLRKRLRKESWMVAAPYLDADLEFCSLVPLCNNVDIRRQAVDIIRRALEVSNAPAWVQSESEYVLFEYLLNCVEVFPNCLNLRRAVSGYRNPGRAEPCTSFDQMEPSNNSIQPISDSDEDTSEPDTDEMDLDDEGASLRQLLIDNTPQWFLDRLDEPYPPLGVWVADNVEIAQAWEAQAKSLKRSVHLLQPERLVMTIHEHESAHICDAESNLVAFVWRNFCPDPSVIDSILKSTAEARRALLLVGDTAAIVDFSSSDSGPASAMRTFWNLCCTSLPTEIISDIQSRCVSTNHPLQRLPSGCVSKNYSSAIVRDDQPPTWKVSWILKQNFNNSHGGSFYLSDYGLRMEPASNTLIAWKASNTHGFGLFGLSQCRQGLRQSVLTIGCLKGLLASFQES